MSLEPLREPLRVPQIPTDTERKDQPQEIEVKIAEEIPDHQKPAENLSPRAVMKLRPLSFRHLKVTQITFDPDLEPPSKSHRETTLSGNARAKFREKQPTQVSKQIKVQESPESRRRRLHGKSEEVRRPIREIKHLEKPVVPSIQIPLSIFIKECLNIPVISYRTWEKNVSQLLVCKVKEANFSADSIDDIIFCVFNDLLKFSSVLNRIDRAREKLFGISEYRFLRIFSGISNPVIFLKNYTQLERTSPFKSGILFNIIGEQESLKIIKRSAEFDGKTMKKNFQSQINSIFSEERKKNLKPSIPVITFNGEQKDLPTEVDFQDPSHLSVLNPQNNVRRPSAERVVKVRPIAIRNPTVLQIQSDSDLKHSSKSHRERRTSDCDTRPRYLHKSCWKESHERKHMPLELERQEGVKLLSPFQVSKEIAEPESPESRRRRLYAKSEEGKRPGRGMYSLDKSTIPCIRVPLSTFIEDCIDIPVISYNKWGKNVNKFIACEVIGFVKDEVLDSVKGDINNIIPRVFHKLLSFSSVLDRIDCARKKLLGIPECRFLEGFAKESNPVMFFRKYTQLGQSSAIECEILFNILGNREALKIIKKSADSGIEIVKKDIQLQLDLITSVEIKKNLLLKSSFSFKENFDVHNLHVIPVPHFLFEYRDWEESFRAYIADDFNSLIEEGIRVNGERFIFPDFKELKIDEAKRGKHFLKWLIFIMQEKLDIKPFLTEEAQLKIFATEPGHDPNYRFVALKTKLSKYLAKMFKDFSSNDDVPVKFQKFLKILQKKAVTKDFVHQMSPHSEFICKYLVSNKGFRLQKGEWEDIAVDLIKLYHRFYRLKEKQDFIPLFNLFQSMCFASYSTAEIFMRETLCPSIINLGASSYHLELNRKVITAYDILVEEKSLIKTFQTTHIKTFEIINTEKIKKEEEIVIKKIKKADVVIHWTLKGGLSSIDYSAALEFSKFDFSDDCPYEERKLILDSFNLAFKISPWGEYLQRKDIFDFLIGPENVPK